MFFRNLVGAGLFAAIVAIVLAPSATAASLETLEWQGPVQVCPSPQLKPGLSTGSASPRLGQDFSQAKGQVCPSALSTQQWGAPQAN